MADNTRYAQADQNDLPAVLERGGIGEGRLFQFASLPSTNQWALEHLPELQHGDVVRTEHQTAGRGRFDRKWVSPAGCCLTLTVVLEPSPADDWFFGAATRLAALAVCGTLEAFKLSAQVKWPNDVLLNGRKVAGILAERSGTQDALIVGIGVNVNLRSSQLESAAYRSDATSMAIEAGRSFAIDSVCDRLLLQVTRLLAYSAGDNKRAFLAREWAKRDALAGRQITIRSTDTVYEGLYLGVSRSGELRLRDRRGVTRAFAAGDVTLLPPGDTDIQSSRRT